MISKINLNKEYFEFEFKKSKELAFATHNVISLKLCLGRHDLILGPNLYCKEMMIDNIKNITYLTNILIMIIETSRGTKCH